MRFWTVLAALAFLLAGCTSTPAADTDTDSGFEPIVVKEGLGAIQGVVVDDRIVPVSGAAIALQGTAHGNATSDAEGRFVFRDLVPGSYFLAVKSPLHEAAQVAVEVEEGAPSVVRVLMARLYEQDPYTVQVKRTGYFQCSQAGASAFYSSSNCVTDPYKALFGPGDSPTQPLDNVTAQSREWHSDVGTGWKSLVFEMDWDPSATGTSQWMGIVVSTYKPEREGLHWFAEGEGPAPFLLRIDQGTVHENAGTVEPVAIPEEGIQDMSYFVSVKQEAWPVPAVAVEQEFELLLTQFYYLPAPEGWSLLQGDPLPF